MFPQPIDRRVSDFLELYSFISLRSVCKTHYGDLDAWEIRANGLPYQLVNTSDKHKIALHYILSCSLMFDSEIGTKDWLQNIVDWLQYHISICIVYKFVYSYSPSMLEHLDFSNMSSRNSLIWKRKWFQSNVVYKSKRYVNDERPHKKRRVSMYRNTQSCFF